MDFRGQHAIITGGSSGIGKAIALLLAQEGAHISLIARGQDRLNAAKAEVEASRADPTQKVVTFAADVSNQADVKQAILAALDQVGPPDLLVTAAGITHPGYFSEIPDEVFERMIAVDYFGTLYAVRAVVPVMQDRKHGYLTLISSGAGLIGVYGYSAYSPAKFAVRGLGEVLRAELKPYGIGVSVVYPPDTDTPQLHEENKIKPPETKAISGTAKTWSADGVARATVNGIKKHAFAIAPGSDMALLSRFHSVLAPQLNWFFDRSVAKVQGKGR